jgi:hypothetical protein
LFTPAQLVLLDFVTAAGLNPVCVPKIIPRMLVFPLKFFPFCLDSTAAARA